MKANKTTEETRLDGNLAVMPSYSQRVEKEAYEMIKKYGKIQAIIECENHINDRRKEINEMMYYDADKITACQDTINYFSYVQLAIHNWA